MFDKYNSKELSSAIAKALEDNKVNPKFEGEYTCLIFIPMKGKNDDGYISADRFGYNHITEAFDYLGCTDIMPFNISNNYQMDFVPGGINLFRKDRKPFHVGAKCFTTTFIDE